jgi:hypothetical protein
MNICLNNSGFNLICPLRSRVDIGQGTLRVEKTRLFNYLCELRDIGQDIERDIANIEKTLLIRRLCELRDIGQDTFFNPKKLWICPAPFFSISLSAPVPTSLVHQFETLRGALEPSGQITVIQSAKMTLPFFRYLSHNSLVHQFLILSAPVRITKIFQAGHRAGHFLPHSTPKFPERDIISPLKMSRSSAKAYKTSKT